MAKTVCKRRRKIPTVRGDFRRVSCGNDASFLSQVKVTRYFFETDTKERCLDARWGGVHFIGEKYPALILRS
jgi:hypothetical protein